MGLFRGSLIISLMLHLIVFLSIAWIKFGNDHNDINSMPITLLKQTQNKPLKRFMPNRPIYSIGKIPSQNIPNTVYQISVKNDNLVPVYTNIQFSKYPSLNFESLNINFVSKSEMKGVFAKPVFCPKNIDIKQNIVKPANIKILKNSGDKFVDFGLATLAKPNVRFIERDNESLSKFLDSIRKKIEANKKYPLLAIESGIEGRTKVKFLILRDGTLQTAEVIASSGSKILDQSALESVYDSAPFPAIPPDIGLDRIEISVYITFEISKLGRF